MNIWRTTMTYKKQEKLLSKTVKSPGKSSKKNLKSDNIVYTVVFKPSASKQFEALETSEQIKIKEKIDRLKNNQFPDEVKKLSDFDNIFRLRVGKFRVLSTIIKQKITIIILKIGHRRNVYKNI